MTWEEFHQKSDEFIAKANMADHWGALEFYLEAAKAENQALNCLPDSDPRIPITLTNTIDLYIKAEHPLSARALWETWQHNEYIAVWAINEVNARIRESADVKTV